MRSSWLASATKERIRASEAARAANADSICSSIELSELDIRPTSVRCEASGIRCDSGWPAAISVAVVSICCNGLSPVRTANQPIRMISSSTPPPIAQKPSTRLPTVALVSSSETATTTTALGSEPVTARTRQLWVLPTLGTVIGSTVWLCSSATV